MPITVICNLEKYEFSGTERIHSLANLISARQHLPPMSTHSKGERSHQSTEETPPHGLDTKIARHFFNGEHDAANRRAERDGYASSTGRSEYFSHFPCEQIV